jgi:geranylgeranyl diphosphate synthase type I
VTRAPERALPEVLAEPARRVDARLEQLLDEEIERWGAVDTELRHPLTTLRSAVLAGGKRLRPAFCFWSFVGRGGTPDDPGVIDAGAALEMLHVAALVHDDIIDGSARRHGVDTVHVQYQALHAGAAWRGDSARFGSGAGILLGDVALVYSDRLLAAAPFVARAVFDEARLEVNLGQYLDILGGAHGPGGSSTPGRRGDGEEAIRRARRICRYKTAKYTVERPLHLGAALAAPDQFGEVADRLSAFGLPLGEAFQLRDDLLGVFGDPTVTGKPVGDDLREGKPTLLASLAWARAAGPSARLLESRFGSPHLTETEVLELRAVIEATGARREVEEAIERLAHTADRALAALPAGPEARDALRQLAEFATARDR